MVQRGPRTSPVPKAKVFPTASETECPESENGSHEALETEKYSRFASSSVLGRTSEKNGSAAAEGKSRKDMRIAKAKILEADMEEGVKTPKTYLTAPRKKTEKSPKNGDFKNTKGLNHGFCRQTLDVLEIRVEFFPKHFFFFQKRDRDLFVQFAVGFDDSSGLGISVFENLADFLVDFLLRFFGDDLSRSFGSEVVSSDLFGGEILRSEFGVESVTHDHGAGDFGRAFNVARRSGGNVFGPEKHLFGRTSSVVGGKFVEIFGLGNVGSVFFGQEPRHPPGTSAGNDGNLMHRIGVREHFPDDRVSDLVVCRNLFFEFGHPHRLFRIAHDDLFDGLLNHVGGNGLRREFSRENRGFV